MPNFSVEAWNTAAKEIEDQEDRFNNALCSGIMNKQEIEEMDQKVKEAYKVLKDFSIELQKRIEDESKGCWSSTGKTILKIHIGTLIANALEQGAETYAVYGGHGYISQSTAFGLATGARWIAYIVEAYVFVKWFGSDSKSNLFALNKDGIEQGRVLKKLIKEVKLLRRNISETENPSLSKKESSQIEIKDLTEDRLIDKYFNKSVKTKTPDERIMQFSDSYAKLKRKNDEALEKGIRRLIDELLPDDDPVKLNLHKLESSCIMATNLPFNYMQSSSDLKAETSPNSVKWQGEESMGKGSEDLSIHKKQTDERRYELFNFQDQLLTRFKIHHYMKNLAIEQGIMPLSSLASKEGENKKDQ
jgi:hypothetical protein